MYAIIAFMNTLWLKCLRWPHLLRGEVERVHVRNVMYAKIAYMNSLNSLQAWPSKTLLPQRVHGVHELSQLSTARKILKAPSCSGGKAQKPRLKSILLQGSSSFRDCCLLNLLSGDLQLNMKHALISREFMYAIFAYMNSLWRKCLRWPRLLRVERVHVRNFRVHEVAYMNSLTLFSQKVWPSKTLPPQTQKVSSMATPVES